LHREEACVRVGAFRDRLADAIVAKVEGAVESAVVPRRASPDRGVGRSSKLPSSFHVRFEEVEAEELLLLLDQAGICASAGAACASGALEPSHVLLAMGLTPTEARSAVRFSLGVTTTEQEIDYAIETIPKLVEQLRR